MIALGLLMIRDAEAVVESRRKLLALASALRLGHIEGTRLAALLSQLTRSALADGCTPALALRLARDEARSWLEVELKDVARSADGATLRACFDEIGAGPAGGALTARKYLPRYGAALDMARIEQLRAQLARPSRAELMRELKLKNEALAGYNARLEETVAERTAELRHARDRMQEDLDAGADYVRRLLPTPLTGSVSAAWHYVPCANLGGDTFGYHWLDRDRFVFFLLDVTGHGIDSALLAVTVAHVLRSGALTGADMGDPASVMAALNAEFPAERHDGKLFTVWYAVYDRARRELAWAGGGHPPALLLDGPAGDLLELPSTGPIIGAVPGLAFEAGRRALGPPAEVFVFSDGCYEFKTRTGARWTYRELRAFLAVVRSAGPDGVLPRLIGHVRALQGAGHFDDDLSILQVSLRPQA